MNNYMLEASQKHDVDRFLFASSACVYRGKEVGLNRFKEEDAYPANPLSTYGWAKLLGEIQGKAYFTDYGVKTSSARIFNAYGPRENLDPKWSHVIPSHIRKAILYPKEEYKIFGDGTQERAFLYVQDCVDGLMRCLEKIADGSAINLGSEETVSINQVAEKIIKLSGKDMKLERDKSGPKGTYKYYANTTKMKKVLKWQPKFSLNEGLSKVYDWAKRELTNEKQISIGNWWCLFYWKSLS